MITESSRKLDFHALLSLRIIRIIMHHCTNWSETGIRQYIKNMHPENALYCCNLDDAELEGIIWSDIDMLTPQKFEDGVFTPEMPHQHTITHHRIAKGLPIDPILQANFNSFHTDRLIRELAGFEYSSEYSDRY